MVTLRYICRDVHLALPLFLSVSLFSLCHIVPPLVHLTVHMLHHLQGVGGWILGGMNTRGVRGLMWALWGGERHWGTRIKPNPPYCNNIVPTHLVISRALTDDLIVQVLNLQLESGTLSTQLSVSLITLFKHWRYLISFCYKFQKESSFYVSLQQTHYFTELFFKYNLQRL